MRLHRLILGGLLALALPLCLISCVANIGPGGAAPGLFYSKVTYPNELQPNMQYQVQFDREDVELLGTVKSVATSRWYFFVASSGDSGYARLMEEARKLGGDGVMNVTIDTDYKNVFLFYARVRMELSGTAYRYRRLPGEPAPVVPAEPK